MEIREITGNCGSSVSHSILWLLFYLLDGLVGWVWGGGSLWMADQNKKKCMLTCWGIKFNSIQCPNQRLMMLLLNAQLDGLTHYNMRKHHTAKWTFSEILFEGVGLVFSLFSNLIVRGMECAKCGHWSPQNEWMNPRWTTTQKIWTQSFSTGFPMEWMEWSG